MKKIVFIFCICLCCCLISTSEAAVFSPAVKCQKDKTAATCLIINETTKVMSCELLVVGETIEGSIFSSSEKELVMPFEKQAVSLKHAGTETFLHANGEASCRYL